MKKLMFIILMLLAYSYSATSQNYSYYEDDNENKSFSDGFFYQEKVGKRTSSESWGLMPLLPQTHGYHYDYPAHLTPIGSGWLLLAGMGVGYALRKRKNEK